MVQVQALTSFQVQSSWRNVIHQRLSGLPLEHPPGITMSYPKTLQLRTGITQAVSPRLPWVTPFHKPQGATTPRWLRKPYYQVHKHISIKTNWRIKWSKQSQCWAVLWNQVNYKTMGSRDLELTTSRQYTQSKALWSFHIPTMLREIRLRLKRWRGCEMWVHTHTIQRIPAWRGRITWKWTRLVMRRGKTWFRSLKFQVRVITLSRATSTSRNRNLDFTWDKRLRTLWVRTWICLDRENMKRTSFQFIIQMSPISLERV